MAPLEGLTLGQRQKYYNQLVQEAITKKTAELSKINFDEDDVDNMIKIDIACKKRNVDYILDVLKCEDMLYVSRAINKSTWLITDAQYAHIINPKYLHREVFPQMNAKAVTKLMLRIRRYLKDEVRVKAFYKYVNEKNPTAALHWLNNCSLEFVEEVVAIRADEIPMKLLKRLCRKSINILRVYVQKQRNTYNLGLIFDKANHFLKSTKTAEEFLDIIYSCCANNVSMNFNKKYTHTLMKKCPLRIKDNFEKFHNIVHLPTFVKYIKADEIRSFLLKHSSTKSRNFATLEPFLVKLPREEILDYLSTLYRVDSELFHDKQKSNINALFHAIEGTTYCFRNVYRWYQFAPFDLAFRDIKKFIFAESSAEERQSMLIVLLTCASYDFTHVKTVLQYYHDQHFNEPYVNKITFVNSLLSQHDTFRFDDSTWNTLNAVFHTLEVYIESGKKVQACLVSIIVHNVLRDLPVSEVVEEKFEIETLKGIKEKLSLHEQDKLFNYLYNLFVEKLGKQITNSQTGMREAIKLLKDIWNLLKDWIKVKTYYQFVTLKIVEFANASSCFHEIKNNQRKQSKKKTKRSLRFTWKKTRKHEMYVNKAILYKMLESYRKELFGISLVLHPSEEALLNALKHDPRLLTRYDSELDEIRCNDDISLSKFLSKLRIYWPDSLAAEWSETNMKYLQKRTGHRALVRGVLTLLPHSKLLDFIKMYIPNNSNIICGSESNEIKLRMQKNIAQNMHMARPQLPADVVLWYAKGDNLQYALLSLNTVYYNLRSSDIRKYISIVLNAPVSISLQRHGIRLAFIKFKTEELIRMSLKIWKKSMNSSIRAILFTSTFNLLCKEKKDMSIEAIWLVLRSFIDDLNHEEKKVIYHTLGKVCDVPLRVVGDYYQKAFHFLKTLPPKSGLGHVLENVIKCAPKVIEYLDSDFVEKSLLKSVYTIIENRDKNHLKILSAYLLCSKDLEIQTQKYDNLLHPVIEKCAPKWACGNRDLLDGFQDFLSDVCRDVPHYVLLKKMEMPIEILNRIYFTFFNIENSLGLKEHYLLERRWQLSVRYLEIIVEIMNKEKCEETCSWEYVRTKSIRILASTCHYFIAFDENLFFTSIYLLYKDVLQIFFEDFGFEEVVLLNVLYRMLHWPSCILVYLVVLEMIPECDLLQRDHDFITRKDNIKRKIFFHPSEEVSMHYFRKFIDTYSLNSDYVCDTDSDDEDDYEPSIPREVTDSELEEISSEDDNEAPHEQEPHERPGRLLKAVLRYVIC